MGDRIAGPAAKGGDKGDGAGRRRRVEGDKPALLGAKLGDLLAMLVCRGLGAGFRCNLGLPRIGTDNDGIVAVVAVVIVVVVVLVVVVAAVVASVAVAVVVIDGEDANDSNSKGSIE